MTSTAPLSANLAKRILRHFGLPAAPAPNLATLRQLLGSYTGAVPWESASRIVRRAHHSAAEDCAILGADFWENHFESGTGGTCYESNYAFFALLLRLGYDGYLTINDMTGAVGCHSALIVLLGGRKYLVDVGFPVHVVLLVDEKEQTRAESSVMSYALEPKGDNRYQLWRKPHPQSDCFVLIDKPVAEARYRDITCYDYRHDGGQFLSELVIHKVVAEQLWRFNSGERPLRLQQFNAGKRRDHILNADPASAVAAKFGIAREVVAEALAILDINCK